MLSLSGQRLSLEQIIDVARGVEHVVLSTEARERVAESRRVVEEITESGRVVYGVNTGFGKLADIRIVSSELRELQLNLVRSHACGVGPPLSEMETRAMLLLRANVLALGYSGARPLIIETLIAMLERGVHPLIPEKGSVGASGDLAPLAHLALTVIGEGEAFYKGERMASSEALKRAGIEPVELEAKEGLALLNGTQGVAAVGGLALHHAREIVETETGSATDNPLVFAGANEVLSGGNFHGAPLALAFDYAAFALTDLISITERRIDRLVNPDYNEGLPPFLTAHPGISSGFMIAQVTAAALLNEARVFAHPASIDNIPTDGGKEDHVSMGMTAATKLRSIVENAEYVVAIELLAAAQGLEFRLPL